MKFPLRALLCAVASLAGVSGWAGVSAARELAVQLGVSLDARHANLTISWEADPRTVSYAIARRDAGSPQWGPEVALAGTAASYCDRAIVPGRAYEYQVRRILPEDQQAFGYITAGADVPLVEARGKVILVVDGSHAVSLARELARLASDLIGDGWQVIRRDVSRQDSPSAVKAVIRAQYASDPRTTRAVLLLGHVPVPYSGLLNPDGHPDHRGAWPADAYYGDMDGEWPDRAVDFQQDENPSPADAARLSNRPGDGKFDPSELPSSVELEVGRVDLANLPGRGGPDGRPALAAETELLRQYLDKDHAYRQAQVSVARRAVVGDFFGVRGGEAFAASGFRNFAPLVGRDAIVDLSATGDGEQGAWVSHLAAANYLFAYGCGPGGYRSCSGLGNAGFYHDADTTEVASSDAAAVFNLLYGSWFGDWDHEDSFLRSVLAARTRGLVAVWSGRPHWFLHAMGLGGTIGDATRRTQNNVDDYRTQRPGSVSGVHIALMGDPTLRLYPVAPPAQVVGRARAGEVVLTWAASRDDAVLGYLVYRATTPGAPFERVSPGLVAATGFTDPDGRYGASYMVRAVKRELTPSGSFFNASQGAFWTPAAEETAVATTATAVTPSGGRNAAERSSEAGPAGIGFSRRAPAGSDSGSGVARIFP